MIRLNFYSPLLRGYVSAFAHAADVARTIATYTRRGYKFVA
jgi:hypothetical protein